MPRLPSCIIRDIYTAANTSRRLASSSSNSTLRITPKFTQFPLGVTNFELLRNPKFAYFDKTSHIVALDDGEASKLLCRPRRFGKSLTISMLQYFHGYEFLNRYDKLFKDLDVNSDVEAGKIKPGEYLVLQFNFSGVSNSAASEINRGLKTFINTYSEILGEWFCKHLSVLDPNDPVGSLRELVSIVSAALDRMQHKPDSHEMLAKAHNIKGIYLLADEYDACANPYMDPHNPLPWTDGEPFRLLKDFWASIKFARQLPFGVRRVYATGITPLLLSDMLSGSNDWLNISFDPEVSAICGLTLADVFDALRAVCKDTQRTQEHFQFLQQYGNGYHFGRPEGVPPVFNTFTALYYLHMIQKRREFAPEQLWQSEVSEPFLRACASLPVAAEEMQLALQKDEKGRWQKIQCKTLYQTLTIRQLNMQGIKRENLNAWQSLMVYMGALTPDLDDPSRSLRVPNEFAAERIGNAILERYDLSSSMDIAVHDLAKTGNPIHVLAGYFKLMRERDVKGDAFDKSEEHHRDSIRNTFLTNPAIKPMVEYEVKKDSGQQGFVDLVIQHKANYSVIEFKNIQLKYLKIPGQTIKAKAKSLAKMDLSEILKLKINSKFHGKNVKEWIDQQLTIQLQSYIKGVTIQKEIADKNVRGWLVFIIGSRQIIVREMDRKGKWVSDELLLVE